MREANLEKNGASALILGKRIAKSDRLSEAACWNLVGTIWQVRSQVRSALLNFYYSSQGFLEGQEAAQSNVVRLLEGQLAVGAVSAFEVTQARVALNTTELAQQDAVGRFNQTRVELARSLGLPAKALDGAKFSFDGLDRFPQELLSPEVRRQALVNRADVRGALAEYAASQAALELEIANEYPGRASRTGLCLEQRQCGGIISGRSG